MEIRALREPDNRAVFSSGDLDLDRFFQKYAGQNQFRHHIGATYVAIEGDRVAGYVTVAPGHVEIENLPAAARKRLPQYPLPILRLARLAVDRLFQGQGLGTQLLRFVLNLALQMAGNFGCVGVVVDAKPEAVPFYRQFGFIALAVVEGESAARPLATAMFLSVQDIAAASQERSPVLTMGASRVMIGSQGLYFADVAAGREFSKIQTSWFVASAELAICRPSGECRSNVI
jgi:GNAT superfamily N-acetyltransferase